MPSKARVRDKTKNERLQDICNQYSADGQPWPAGNKAIAAWAIRTKRWTAPQKSLIDQCAQELADAMRAEMETDPQGRTVHAKRFAKIKEVDEDTGNLVQKMIWFDSHTRTGQLMRVSQAQWRKSILGECRQFRIEEESFNDNNTEGAVLTSSLDFEIDLHDEKHGTEYNPSPPQDDQDDS